MKNYLAVYTGSPEAMDRWKSLGEAERKQKEEAGMKAWREWVAKTNNSIVYDGGPLGRTKQVSRTGTADIRNGLAAFTVVRADSHEEAARLFENHPHFTLFPGEGVEIMEVLPMPDI